MTTAVTPLSTVPKLALAAVRYVADVPAPEPACVELAPTAYQVSIQPRTPVGDSPVEVIGALLIWTHRLTGITGTWWHTPSGQLHITLEGRGPYGVQFRVYSAFGYRRANGYVRLSKGERESVTPDELYRLALELRTKEEHR